MALLPFETIFSTNSSADITVAFQGSAGSFSEQALTAFFGMHVQCHTFLDFKNTFTAVQYCTCDFGIVPIENTSIGTIHTCFENFSVYRNIQIIADISIRIEHALIGLPHATLDQVKNVFSQLPGLEQCREFLDAHPHWHIMPYRDTAAAVEYVAKKQDVHNTAIASVQAAAIHGLHVLVKGIETNHSNYTRFAIIVRDDAPLYVQVQADDFKKNTGFIVFTTKDIPGALLYSLEVFAQQNINLHKIESRPIFGKPWEYQFIAEIDFTVDTKTIAETLDLLRKVTQQLHVVGIYKREKAQA